MVFLAAEAITGKPVNEDLQVKLTIGGKKVDNRKIRAQEC
ncbi:MAG: hypothetical protein ACKO9Q_05545 [Pirellula sp.]